MLDGALHETCEYAQQLWHDLDAMRGYLLSSLPPDPRSPGPHPTTSASPTGPDDETGWENWISAYATVTSILCGPHGDSGYGLSEGRHEAELRRSAPVLRIHAEHPELDTAATHDAAAKDPAAATKSRAGGRSRTARAAATTVLVLLALRGLRPQRRSYP